MKKVVKKSAKISKKGVSTNKPVKAKSVVKQTKSINKPKPVAIKSKAQKAKPQQTEPSLSSRAPLKRVLSTSGLVSTAPKKLEPESVMPVAQKKEEQKAPPVDSQSKKTKISWQELPKYVPHSYRFLLKMADNECAAAAVSPFPFAKFLSNLPKEICGEDFALLIMSLDHSTKELSELLKQSEEVVEERIKQVSSAIEENFDSSCNEMARKIRMQLGKEKIQIESSIVPYHVPKVDPAFQMMVAEVLIRSFQGA